MPSSNTPIIAVVGPTASGKSDLAVGIAREFRGEIISADSRQVYRGLDIGSGKITADEMQGISHHLIDVADPRDTYTVSEYVRDAQAALAMIQESGKAPIICGGTGFYIEALTDDASIPDVPPNEALRSELRSKAAPELFALLAAKDPSRAASIDRNNPHRLIRALEIVAAHGYVPPRTARPRTDIIWIGIDTPRAKLRDQIRQRLMKRVDQGLIEEVASLHSHGVSWQRLESLGLEYKYVALYLQTKLPKDLMIETLYREICAYAKRQMTWFRRNKQIRWFDSPQKQDLIFAYIGEAKKKTAETRSAA